MDNIRIETNRLILRRFEENDLQAIYLLTVPMLHRDWAYRLPARLIHPCFLNQRA